MLGVSEPSRSGGFTMAVMLVYREHGSNSWYNDFGNEYLGSTLVVAANHMLYGCIQGTGSCKSWYGVGSLRAWGLEKPPIKPGNNRGDDVEALWGERQSGTIFLES